MSSGEGLDLGGPKNYIAMTDEQLQSLVANAVQQALSHHQCFLTDDERSIITDVAVGGRLVKRGILAALAGGLLWLVIKGAVAVKGLGFIK